MACGEFHSRAKLTWKKVREIRNKYAAGKYTHRQLAYEYGVSTGAISPLLTGKAWQNDESTLSELAAEMVREFPHIRHIQLAWLLVHKHPDRFRGVKHARQFVKYVRGTVNREKSAKRYGHLHLEVA